MSNLNSLRIVTADYYMHYPLQGLDPCYSEFRGASVKNVPVIRIFGTDPSGCKTCMHVHGALPYLYIPCPDYTQSELDTFVYQVAISLDKAINLSLGQSSSETQHVFKVVCVKAIAKNQQFPLINSPFYGYHPNEHRFLKIYFYNPMFIRRAANLLQNGAILNKIHQPHESHLPYLLQFLIDFNLYGMSFIHVPADVVRYRRRPRRDKQSNESEGVDTQMYFECTSVSECEIDVSAAHILNRLEIFDQSSGCHANPGIASIWNDERCRRSKIEGDCPPLEISTSTQESMKVFEPTESETFYLQALIKKLEEPDDSVSTIFEQDSERTILLPDRTMKKFNINAYLSQLVYPAECINENAETLLNASIIVDHLSSAVNGKRNVHKQISNHSANDTIIDDELVMSLSQRCSADETLTDEDKAFLEVLRKLEANECDLDDDSILAPFSQKDEKTEVILSQQLAYGTSTNAALPTDLIANEQNYLNDDDELLNGLNDLFPEDDLQMKIPQMDGGSDESLKRNSSRFQPLNIIKSPKRTSSVSDSVVEMLKGKTEITVSAIPARSKLATNQSVNVKPLATPEAHLIDLTETSDEEEISPTQPTKKPRLEDAATDGKLKRPQKNLQHTNSLNIQHENSSTSSVESVEEKSNVKVKLSPSFMKIISTSPIVKLKKISNTDHEQPACRRYPTRERRPPVNSLSPGSTTSRTVSSNSTKDKKDKKDKKKLMELEDMYDWSECRVALEHDFRYNFFPEPGPSHINRYGNCSLPGYYPPISMNDDPLAEENLSEYDFHIQSLYDATMLHQSPNIHAHSPDPLFNISDPDDDIASPFQISTPLLHSIKANFMSPCNRSRNKETYIATPVTITPTAGTVLADLINYDLPQVVSKTPFYSNCDDVVHFKEVGSHIIQTPNSNECEPFESSLISTGLNAWRRNIYMNIMSMDDKEKLQNKSLQEIREFFAVQKRIVITPNRIPPTVHQVDLWLRKKTICKEDTKETMDIESPIGIKRERAKIILENGAADGDQDSNECDVSLSCSPLPTQIKSQNLKPINKHLTKVNRTVKAKKSLNSTFDDLKKSNVVRESPSLFSESESPTNENVPDSDDEIPSSQVITIKRPKANKHLNGHTENASNCVSDSSTLVNSVS